MARKVTAAHAKAQFSALAAEVAHRGQRVLIERRGKPLAALVSVDDLERLEQGQPTAAHPLGALALVGAWREVPNEEVDSLVAEIYEARDRDTGRAIDLEA